MSHVNSIKRNAVIIRYRARPNGKGWTKSCVMYTLTHNVMLVSGDDPITSEWRLYKKRRKRTKKVAKKPKEPIPVEIYTPRQNNRAITIPELKSFSVMKSKVSETGLKMVDRVYVDNIRPIACLHDEVILLAGRTFCIQ